MLEATTRIHVRDPQRADNLVPGVVSEMLENKVMVRFLEPVSFSPGVKTSVYFYDPEQGFMSAPCQLQRMFSRGQYPTGALVLEGEPTNAESRNSTRIHVKDGCITATLNDREHAEVTDISCGGIAVLLPQDGFNSNDWLEVIIHDGRDEHSGRMQVRGKNQNADGRYRYGLMADPDEPGLISQLSRITQQLQNNKKGSSHRPFLQNDCIPASEDNSATIKNAASKNNTITHAADHDTIQKNNTKRQHQRNAWPGMAKIYIREETNLRVLSVETADLSRGGISFLCPTYIYEGSEVLFEKPIAGGFFRVMLSIRNVRIQNGTTHRVGAQFLGAPLAPGKMPEGFIGNNTAA